MKRFTVLPLFACLTAIVLCSARPALAFDLQANFVAEWGGTVDIRNAGDGSGRLFLVRQDGIVAVVEDGELSAQPFLDISDRVADPPESWWDEYNYGLLSIAFAPDFASSGVLYANYTNNDFTQTISRFRLSDPQVADPASEEILLTFTLPSLSHNGGHLVFGPDSYLYVSVGDGQDSGLPTEAPQRLDNLMGKVLRIDVSGPGGYAVPADNPFVGTAGARGEIWAYGLRNPWRIAFDPLGGDLYISDAGEFDWEEVNHQPAAVGGGQNYGWRLMEGAHCHIDHPGCSQSGMTLPVAEFAHPDTPNGVGCTVVIGGEVYRGSAYPDLHGLYLYADGCLSKTWGLSCTGGACQSQLLTDAIEVVGGPNDGEFVDSILTFGKGEDGSLYFSDFGWVYQLSDGPLVAEPGLPINVALSDAWLNPATPGQGFFFTVLPASRQVFAGFFTYELAGVAVADSAAVGSASHRWLTAQGSYQGDTATLDITLSTGGAFDEPQAVSHQAGYGTLTVRFDNDCMHADARVVIPSLQLDRVIPLERIAADKRQACLDLAGQLRLASP